MSAPELEQAVRTVDVYARVDPEHKLRIVQELARQGAVVAMTGDGVNDAPALKTADIGVAMGITGSDVSKQAADMVLADDNFASIVAAVEEGRAIFANIRTFLRYLLSSNMGEVMTMFFGIVLASPLGLRSSDGHIILPVVATQLLWINLLTDGAPALALGVEPPDPHDMSRAPRRKSESVITVRMWAEIAFIGLIMASACLIVFDASLPGGLIRGNGEPKYAQTRTFTTLTLCQFFNVFNARSSERSAFERLLTNRWLWMALASSCVLQWAVIYTPALQRAFSTVPLTATDWWMCAALASSVLWVGELRKLAGWAWQRLGRRRVAVDIC
jgi:Ca2+-transporting ATPase